MSKIILSAVAGLVFFLGCQRQMDLGELSFYGATRIGDSLHADLKKDQLRLQLKGKMSGTKISGTLKPTGDGGVAYMLSEDPQVKVLFNPDDLFVYGTTSDYAKFGVGLNTPKKHYSADEIAGKFNFVLRYRSENDDKYSFGTFELRRDKTWHIWRFVAGTQAKEEPTYSGYWIDSGTGEIRAYLDNDRFYAALVIGGISNDLLVINFFDKNGLALCMKRRQIKSEDVEGVYTMLGSEGGGLKKKIITSNGYILHKEKDPVRLIYNEPYEGFFRDDKGERIGICSRGICFGFNIGALSGTKYIFAALRDHKNNSVAPKH